MDETLPLGGVTAKKYAAICLALGMARGVLYGVQHGDLDGVKDICDLTSLAAIATALGFNEGNSPFVGMTIFRPLKRVAFRALTTKGEVFQTVSNRVSLATSSEGPQTKGLARCRSQLQNE